MKTVNFNCEVIHFNKSQIEINIFIINIYRNANITEYDIHNHNEIRQKASGLLSWKYKNLGSTKY